MTSPFNINKNTFSPICYSIFPFCSKITFDDTIKWGDFPGQELLFSDFLLFVFYFIFFLFFFVYHYICERFMVSESQLSKWQDLRLERMIS